MSPIRRLSAPLFLAATAAAALAQVPSDGVVVFTTSGSFAPTSCQLVDAEGGGATELFLGFTPLSFTPPTAVATDPANAQFVWFLNDQGTIEAGIQRAQVGLLGASVGSPSGFAWTQAGGTRLRVGGNRVFTLRSGGLVEATPRAGGAPFLLLTEPRAVDLAVLGNLLYVACRDLANPAVPAPVFEWNLLTGVPRTVGSYADVRRIAVRRTPGGIALGTSTGLVLEVDTTNGSIVGTTVANGAVEALAYTASGTLVWATVQPGGFELYSSTRPAPLFTSSQLLIDLDVGVVRSATATPYGAGCGAGAAADFAVASAPALGNTAFALEVTAAPANLPLALFFGGSRVVSATFGNLPAALGSLAVGCELLVDPLVPFGLLADATGRATLPLPIPATPALAGAEWSGQAFVLDPSVGPLGFAGSRGIALRLEP